MARHNITRISIDLTTTQREALDAMIAHHEQAAREAAGLVIEIRVREFMHRLLRQHAESLGLAWPEDYPKMGGRREHREFANSRWEKPPKRS